jgi:hypothetical protein
MKFQLVLLMLWVTAIIAKDKIDQDFNDYKELPFNFTGTINHGTYNLTYLNKRIEGEIEVEGSNRQNLNFHLWLLSDSLIGKMKNREILDLKYKNSKIIGKIKDLRPVTMKMNGKDCFYGFNLDYLIDTVKVQGLVTQEITNKIKVDVSMGNYLLKGNIFLQKDKILYNLVLGSKVIKGYRSVNNTECNIYLAKLDEKELICFLLIDLIFRDARYAPPLGIILSPF